MPEHHAKLKEFKQPDLNAGQSFPYYHETPQLNLKGEEGKRFEVHCRIGGTPLPKVSWKKGQWLQLDDGGRFQVTFSAESGKCMLAIKNCRMADMGKYRVVATNEFGESAFHFHVDIEKGNDGSPAMVGFKAKLKSRKIKAKKELTPEEKEKEILELLKKSNPKHYERICLDNGFFDFRMILKKLKGMQQVEHVEPECESVRVMKKLRHVTCNDEGTAVFETHLENVEPGAKVQWFHNGELLEMADGPDQPKRHEFRKVGNVHQLIIRNCAPGDAGNYTLEVGKERFDAALTIKEKPLKFEVGLEDKSAKVHGRVMFMCVISQRGKMVHWLKDGKEIDLRHTNGRIEAVTEGKQHRLNVTELNMKDAGKYSIKIGNIESSAQLTVTAPPIKFRHRLVNTEVAERGVATFDCSVNNKEAEARWTINGKVVKTGGRYKIQKGDIHSLQIKNVSLKDNNAKVAVSFGEAKSNAVLHVNAKPIKIITKLTNVKCKIGDPAEFSTAIDLHDDKVAFTWLKDDKPIDLKSNKYEVKRSRGRYQLRVKRATVDDEGHYAFQVRGCHQEATLSCSSPPSVKNSWLDMLRKTPMRAKAGEKLEIEIPLEGRAPMNASWNNGRTTLSNHGRFKIEIDNDKKVAKLTIDPVRADDSGVYEATISNDCGEVNIKIPVQIVDKPAPPSGQVALSDVTANSVKLNWNSPIDDQTTVEGYVIEMKDPVTGEWKKVADVDKDTHDYKVDGLKEGDEYQFRVMSKNEIGLSDPLNSKTVVPLSPNQAPKVDPEVIEHLEQNPIYVKAGATASIKIPCQGNPPPSVMWLHEDEEIIPSKHHRATKYSSMNEVELVIKKCKASDSGTYEAKIFNNSGGIEVMAHVVVLDVPDMSKNRINFDKVTDKSVGISWTKPEDSSSPVKGYVIERCVADNYELWEKVGEVPGDATKFDCDNCKEDTRYYFRVSATNDQGQGAPVTSSPVTCASAQVAPTVDDAVIAAFAKAPIKVKFGQTCRINIPMKGGQPPPTVTWEKDGKPIDDDGHRVVVDHSDHDAAHISVHKAVADDAGRYVCKIKNAAGEVAIPVNVEVLAPPAKVEGDIKFKDISSKGVDLEWTPVKDDGGLPVTNYVIERKEEGRKVWSQVGKTPGTTCKFHSTGIPGKKYQYRVKAVNGAAEGDTSNESDLITLKDDFDTPDKVQGEINKVDSTDDSITINWEEVKNDGGSPLIGYVVEKRKKGQAGWVKCNEPEKCTKGELKINKLQKGADYEFRVMAVNAAGESDPSVPSRPYQAIMSMAPPGEPTDLKLLDSTNTTMTLGWREADLCGGSDIIGYEVELKMEGEDKWMPYTSSPIRGNQFTLRGLQKGKSYQARIRTLNKGAHSRWYYMNKNLLAAETLILPEFKITPELEVAMRKGIEVKAGTTIRLHVPYHARPRPTIKWTRDGEVIDEALVNDLEGISQLQIRGTRSWHTGKYTIALTNSSGTQTLDINVVVIDVPTAPIGPLVTSNITDSGVTLSWSPPKQDGGNRIKSYTVQKREARGRGWATISTKVRECHYTVTDLPKQRSFHFQVMAENEIGLGEGLQTKDVIFFKLKVEKVQIEELCRDEKDLRKPPQVTVPLKARKVPDGVKVTLSCSVSGKPYPDIRWLKNGMEICDRNIFKENVIGLCRLVIKKSRASDSGVYKVIATNEVGEAETEATLTITT